MNKIATFFCMISVSAGVFAAAPGDYYDSCEGKSGKDLLTALLPVVGPHTTVSYKNLLELYKTSDVYPDGKIWDMYSTKHWTVGTSCGSYQAVGDCYNREHSFPKSWFDDASPMYSDAFHIYPTDGKVNGQRNNYPYGECASGTTLPSSNGVDALGKLGTSTFPGYTKTVFEPVDEYKGDFARSYFYMAAAYNDKISTWDSDMLSGDNYPAFSSWALNLLLKWHRQDPVSQKEIDRNEVVYGRQGNRNPFIDHPELAEYIWGTKTADKWYANGSDDPVINLPVDGSTVDFGTTSVNYSMSRSIAVKGSNLSEPVSLSVDSQDFTLSTTSIAAATVNGGNATVSVVFRSATAKTVSAVLTVKSGNLVSRVNLTATVVDGIPALAATGITESSFIANWIVLGDEETYSIDVTRGGVSIDGYPRNINAEEGQYRVTGLLPETAYSYKLTSETKVSNVVSVTTAAMIPSIELILSGDIELMAAPESPSEPVDLYLEAENIEGDITVSVAAPFEVSADMSGWARSVTLGEGEDIFYLRLGATAAGDYRTSIRLSAGDYLNDGYEATATVVDSSSPWFIEDFEAIGSDGGYYTGKTVEGSACLWNVTDTGFWTSDANKNGSYSARLGKTATSSLTTASAKRDGIGTVSFQAAKWSANDKDMVIAVEYSADNGATWQQGGNVTVTADSFKSYTVTVNTEGDNLLRLRQTAGARGNIDDIVVADYKPSSSLETAQTASWTAVSDNGCLVIGNNDMPALFTVYDIEGRTIVSRVVSASPLSINLANGIYIVACGSDAVRVLVH